MTNVAQKRFVAAWSVLETYLCCGVIFGWPNLKKIFIQENVFCTDVIPVSNETSFDITATVVADNVSTTIPPTTLPDESLDSCSSQETDLTNAYTYACVVFALV